MNPSDELSRRGFMSGGLRFGVAGLATPFAGAALAAEEAEKEKERWQVGCYTRPWAKYDYRVGLDAIAEAGFKYAGLMTAKGKNNLVISVATTPEEAAQVGDEVKKRGLKVPSVYGGGHPRGHVVRGGDRGA